jgi:glycosyltransferase involved in cell wall biosynthesis
VKIACVIHRFGSDIAGGSESHCRAIAQHLAAAHQVTVITSCASDHVSWANHYPAGESTDGALRVLRFPTVRQRNLAQFRDISRTVFSGRASAAEQEQWFRENGPDTPQLLEYLQRHGRDYDRLLFWSYRYFQTYFGLPLVADRAVLLPTAEEDPLIHASALERFFALPAGYLFLTPEEADLVGERAAVRVPSAIIGCGVDPPGAETSRASLDRAAADLRPLGIADPFVLYLGRVDPNKGCEALVRNFSRYVATRRDIQLVLAGPVNMPVPDHPAIRVLGFVTEPVRDALLARARVLMMPSPYESLSMVLIEAWNRGLPALVNARCAVLRGQVRRANGGLHYRTSGEFAAALDWLLTQPDAARTLGAQGLAYVEREYRWPIVTDRIERLLQQVGREQTVSLSTP